MKYDNGTIALWRKFLDWEWYEDVNTKAVFLHLLLTANWKDKRWKGILIKRGQRWASRNTLARETGLSEQSIRTALEHLKTTGEITIKATSQGTLINVEKYSDYQIQSGEADQRANQRSNQRPTSDQPLLNKDNNNNNIKGTKIPPSREDVQRYISEKSYHVDVDEWFDFYESKGWVVGKAKMKDWKASVRLWDRREQENQKSESAGFKELR